MAESDFIEYLTYSLRSMLTTKSEELVRVSFSKETYSSSSTELRPQGEIDAIVSSLRGPIEQLAGRYICEMKASGLTTPELVKANAKTMLEITARMERDLEKQLRNRLEINDD